MISSYARDKIIGFSSLFNARAYHEALIKATPDVLRRLNEELTELKKQQST